MREWFHAGPVVDPFRQGVRYGNILKSQYVIDVNAVSLRIDATLRTVSDWLLEAIFSICKANCRRCR